jgi:hypothetical protein
LLQQISSLRELNDALQYSIGRRRKEGICFCRASGCSGESAHQDRGKWKMWIRLMHL